MNSYLKSGIVLCSICIILALALAGVNSLTAPIISDKESQAVLESLGTVYEGAKKFTPVNIEEYTDMPLTVKEAYSVDDLGGYVIKIVTTGYSNDFVIMVGIDADGVVKGAESISNTETPSIGGAAAETYGSNFIGLSSDEVDGVDTVGGATRTTAAYKNAVKDALGAAIILGGGSYDTRTDEEIKRDGALPAAEGQFENLFYAEVIEGLSAVYSATNGAGYVLVYGDTFVGIDASGEVTDAIIGIDEEYNPIKDESYSGSAKADIAAILASSSSPIDFSSYGLSSYIDSVEKTVSGNYIFVIRANGYNMLYGYSPVKTPIKIKVSVSAEGKIICTQTLEQAETEGIGSVCADPDYYSQFNGKTIETYTQVDTVTGATVTTTAYRGAIEKVLNAVTVIEAALGGEGGTSNE